MLAHPHLIAHGMRLACVALAVALLRQGCRQARSRHHCQPGMQLGPKAVRKLSVLPRSSLLQRLGRSFRAFSLTRHTLFATLVPCSTTPEFL